MPPASGWNTARGQWVARVRGARTSGTQARTWRWAAAALAAAMLWIAAPAHAAIAPPPGGPILVVNASADPFGTYLDEILRAEGLNEFATTDAASLDAAALAGHQVVLLGPAALTDAQVAALTSWVRRGGDLIAMRPDPKLAGLLGLAGNGGTLDDGYLRVDTGSAPGAGITSDTMQFHGTADRYGTAPGTRAVATLYEDATTATTNPAVTLRSVGSAGGQAAAFTYDLGRSVVYTHQGNPAWAAQDRDGVFDQGTTNIRSDDLFFGGDSTPDYVDLDKVRIPQADEQQRLLANLITGMAADRLPVPRLWYLPGDNKAAIVMTGDEHGTGSGGTEFAFDRFKDASKPGCSVADWECIRATAYVYTVPSVAPAAAKAYEDEGFEIGLHMRITGPYECNNYTSPQQVQAELDRQLDGDGSFTGFLDRYADLQPPTTIRTHCIVWSDWDSEVRADASRGIRLNTDYYYWPAGWVAGRSGMFTGAGFPMRYAAEDGSVFDVYQATTQMPDETFTSGPEMDEAVTTLLTGALGPKGYYGVFTVNNHNDSADPATHAPADAVVAAAQARGVPVISARQMLTWLDGREHSSFGGISFGGGQLRFTMTVGAGARNLRAMIPVAGPGGALQGLERDGAPVAFTVRTIKGVDYAVFDGEPGAYAAQYAGGDGTAGAGDGDAGSGDGSGGAGTGGTPGATTGATGSSTGADGATGTGATGSGATGSGGASGGGGGTPSSHGRPPTLFDRKAPGLVVAGATRQRLGRTLTLTLRATTENLWATASGTVAVSGSRRTARLTPLSRRFVAKGRRVAIRLKLPSATARSIERALRARGTATATITIRARDAAGNVTVRRRAVRFVTA